MSRKDRLCRTECIQKGKRKLICHGFENAYDWDDCLKADAKTWGAKLREFLADLPKVEIAIIRLPENWVKTSTFQYAVAAEIPIGFDEKLPQGFCIMDYLIFGDVFEVELSRPEGEEDWDWQKDVLHVRDTYDLEADGYEFAPEVAPVFYYPGAGNCVRLSFPIARTQPRDHLEQNLRDQLSKEELYRTAYYDDITGCHNWNWMVYKLYHFREEGIREFGFVHFDIKDFKMINENFGTEKADAMLRYVGKILGENRSWIYHYVRCDNDNFAMMIKPMSREQARQKLEFLFRKMQRAPFDWDYPVFYRCGVVLQDIGVQSMNVVANMTKLAQKQGTNLSETDINFYTEEMHEEYIRNKKLRSEIDRGFENDEFIIYLQPKYHAQQDRLSGAEALIRWNYKKEKVLSPAQFVPFMEKDGSISKIDELVLRKACLKLQEWKHRGYPLLPISVNISRVQLNRPNLVEKLRQIVEEYDVDFSLIDFELTESVAYDNTEYMLDIMRQLQKLGFRLSMDDFGTGFSSLSLLKDMPLDTLKIDKSFVDGILNMTDNHKEQWIVKDIITMANHMKIESLAEGAETFEQKELLRQWGCQYIQGYYYSKPLPVDEYEKLLEKIMSAEPVDRDTLE